MFRFSANKCVVKGWGNGGGRQEWTKKRKHIGETVDQINNFPTKKKEPPSYTKKERNLPRTGSFKRRG